MTSLVPNLVQDVPKPLRVAGAARRLEVVALFHERISGVAFTKGGERVVTSGLEGTLRVWDPRTGERLEDYALPGEEILAYGLSASADGTVLGLSRGGYPPDLSGSPELWRNGIRLPCPVKRGALVISPDGRLAVAWSIDMSEVTVFAVATGEVVTQRSFDRSDMRILRLAFGGRSTRLGVFVQFRGGKGGTHMYLLDATDLSRTADDAPDTNSTLVARLANRHRRIFVDEHRVLEVHGGAVALRELDADGARDVWRTTVGEYVRHCAVSVKARRVAYAMKDGTVVILDLEDGKQCLVES